MHFGDLPSHFTLADNWYCKVQFVSPAYQDYKLNLFGSFYNVWCGHTNKKIKKDGMGEIGEKDEHSSDFPRSSF